MKDGEGEQSIDTNIELLKSLLGVNQKTKEDEKVIKEWAKKDFYVEYMIKKYEKMNLITKEGIFRPRMLDRTEAILNVINGLKEVAKVTKNTELRDIVRNQIKKEMRLLKIPLTVLGEEQATREALGMLSMYRTIESLKQEIKKLEHYRAEARNPLTIEKEQLIRNTIKAKEDAIQKVKEGLKEQQQELEHYKEVNDKYNETINK